MVNSSISKLCVRQGHAREAHIYSGMETYLSGGGLSGGGPTAGGGLHVRAVSYVASQCLRMHVQHEQHLAVYKARPSTRDTLGLAGQQTFQVEGYLEVDLKMVAGCG